MTPGQFDTLIGTIKALPSILEFSSWIATVVLAAVAVCALEFAKGQTNAAEKAAKGVFIIDIDKRWESEDMMSTRAEWRRFREEIAKHVADNFAELSDRDKQNKQSEVAAAALHRMHLEDTDRYVHISKLLGFFETTGYTISKGYLHSDDVSDLYGEAILDFDRLCWSHIEKRREDQTKRTGVPTKLWEHARNLILNTRKFYGIT